VFNNPPITSRFELMANTVANGNIGFSFYGAKYERFLVQHVITKFSSRSDYAIFFCSVLYFGIATLLFIEF